MDREFGRKATVGATIVALGTVGSVVFGGVALAGRDSNAGSGGNGGPAKVDCVLPLNLSLGLVGQGGDQTACNADGGAGGTGGSGAKY